MTVKIRYTNPEFIVTKQSDLKNDNKDKRNSSNLRNKKAFPVHMLKVITMSYKYSFSVPEFCIKSIKILMLKTILYCRG